MRTLLLLRGSAGCGKSTWIEENGLKQYTLSADDIRLAYRAPVLQVDGTVGISQSSNTVVWKTLFQILEDRMKRGEFTVIDATNSKTSEMKRYKDLCSTYKYRIYCVDFTDIPIEEVKRRNAEREEFKRVPEEVIDKMYSRFATQGIPSGIKVIKPDQLDDIWLKCIDLSGYKKIHHIGDIHGCNTVLQEYLNADGGLHDDEFYIFLGDYIDRGIENAEVIQFLLSIKDNPNVLLLEGNHEKWLAYWSRGESGMSREFEQVTKPQLEATTISRKEVRTLYQRFAQCAYYKYDNDIFLVTHGGLSTIPDNISLISTEQMIKGVGNYRDAKEVDDAFESTMPENVFQIHGHRNVQQLPIKVNEHAYNLEGQVEFGGCLRCVEVSHDGICATEVQNHVFRKPEKKVAPEPGSVAEAVEKMRENAYVDEKQFGPISSFNFSREAFEKRIWDEQTVKARGLYIDTEKNKVVARSYDKFFAINERPETKLDVLQRTLNFPVTAYVKENGFLGIVSYNEYSDDLFITTKSNPEGDYTGWFKDMLQNKLGQDNLNLLKEYVRDNNVSFVFECVDMLHDPHIIEYAENEIYLLDIIYNDLKYQKYSYDDLCRIAQQFGFTPKEKAYEIGNWPGFYDWYCEVMDKDYEYHGREIEGFVIEDNAGKMLKLKLTYYNFWKFMRGVAKETLRKGYVNPRKTSALITPLANDFYAWLKTLYKKENIPSDICSLRRMYYQTKQGGLK